MKTLEQANYDLLYGEKKPVTCPVCCGKGLVPYGFYEIGRTEFSWGFGLALLRCVEVVMVKDILTTNLREIR